MCGYADVRIFEWVKCGCWCRKRSALYWCTCRMPYPHIHM